MLKFKKKIISLITSLTVSSSIFIGIPITTEAVTTENSISTEKSSKNYNLPEDVKDGVILHAWNWSFNQVKELMEVYKFLQFNLIKIVQCKIHLNGGNYINL